MTADIHLFAYMRNTAHSMLFSCDFDEIKMTLDKMFELFENFPCNVNYLYSKFLVDIVDSIYPCKDQLFEYLLNKLSDDYQIDNNTIINLSSKTKIKYLDLLVNKLNITLNDYFLTDNIKNLPSIDYEIIEKLLKNGYEVNDTFICFCFSDVNKLKLLIEYYNNFDNIIDVLVWNMYGPEFVRYPKNSEKPLNYYHIPINPVLKYIIDEISKRSNIITFDPNQMWCILYNLSFYDLTLSELKILLDVGANPMYQIEIILANLCNKGNIDVMTYYLNNFNIDINDESLLLLSLAISSRKIEIVKLLLEMNICVRDHDVLASLDNYNIFMLLYQHDSIDLTDASIKLSKIIFDKNKKGKDDHLKIVQFMIDNGINFNHLIRNITLVNHHN